MARDSSVTPATTELESSERRTMYVYIESQPGLFTVGFYDPSGDWHPESDHPSRELAVERVHYLNGK